MMDIGWTVLSGIAAGALWGWYFAGQNASRQLEFWRDQASKLQGEHEGMVKALAEVTAQREALHGEVALLRHDVQLRIRKREQDAKRRAKKAKGEA